MVVGIDTFDDPTAARRLDRKSGLQAWTPREVRRATGSGRLRGRDHGTALGRGLRPCRPPVSRLVPLLCLRPCRMRRFQWPGQCHGLDRTYTARPQRASHRRCAVRRLLIEWRWEAFACVPSQRGGEAGGSLFREVPGRVGAALTRPWRVGTARRRGCGERGGKAYARNRPSASLNDAPARTWRIWAGGDAHPSASSRGRGTSRTVGVRKGRPW